ncbi:stage III sporulation protein AF [Bacillus sp. REN10]|uniref:stage III sporulation protein AF n=1 Tax=Bacillus sp. REN10 TaxID=2782541 RepID=UPI00193B62E2|nr:stage III sporulation protein AF [Bacillus sp. REN10]
MAFIVDWLSKVLTFILLAAVVDMLLPSSSFQRYARVVMGLLLLLVMLNPIWTLFSINMEQELYDWMAKQAKDEQLEQELSIKQDRLESTKQLYILKNAEQQLRAEVEAELKNQFQKKIIDLNIEVHNWGKYAPEDIAQVDVYIASINEQESSATVDEVVIDSSFQSQETQKEEQSLIDFLSKKWNIPTEQLNIHKVEEGDSLE